MDPSLSVSNDPHHPPFTAFTPFTNSNPFGAPQHPFFGGATVAPPNNNQFFQAPPQQAPVPPNPSYNHPPYSDMICSAIAALNEPDGSSKQAISRYIERIYTGIPPAHGALLTHHLKTLKSSGVLTMVKKSYKFAATAPPTSVAVAAAAQAAGLEPPRSDYTSNIVNESQLLLDPTVASAPQTQKRGRGRPPKLKFDVQSNGNSTWEHNELLVSQPEVIQTHQQQQPQLPFRRPPGRPRKDGALPRVKATVPSGVGIAKRRGRPPSVRAAGRERKPTVVSAPVSVIPYVANGGVRRRGRPRRVDNVASSVAPPPQPNVESGGEEVAGVVVAKRGRGRPPRIGGVIRKPMKPKGAYVRTGKPVGRPRKNATSKGVSGQQDIGYGELKKKFESFQEKAKDIVNVLRAEIGASENQAVVQALQNLEELTVTTTTTTTMITETATTETTEEPQPQPQPQHIEEMQTDEQHPEQEQGQGQTQTEAEAMQEALF